MKVLILSLCLFIHMLHAEDPWKGEEYARNSKSQESSAMDFMGKGRIGAFQRILDVGCGDGKITAAMAQEIPDGSVTGVDISPSMIAFSETAFSEVPNLDFFVSDAANIDFSEEFDLITSFTVMQWVLEQETALKKFKRALKPEGRLWIQIPTGLPAAMQQALDETIASAQWQDYFTEFAPPWRFYQAEEYRSLLLSAGFTPLSIETIRKHEKFPSRDVIHGFLRQWFPYLRPLPEKLKDRFLSEVLDRYLEILPADHNGHVSFIVDRIEVEAKK